MDITRRKTAELFAAACALPALFKPATLHLTEALLDFGRELGLCFQLVDDLLDFTSNRSRLGKPVLADLARGPGRPCRSSCSCRGSTARSVRGSTGWCRTAR